MCKQSIFKNSVMLQQLNLITNQLWGTSAIFVKNWCCWV